MLLQKPVDAVMIDQPRYRGVPMRVTGELLPSSFAKKSEPCEVWMVLQQRGSFVTVHLPHCSLPDRFRSDAEIPVVAEGKLRDDGIFEAKQILVAVPSF